MPNRYYMCDGVTVNEGGILLNKPVVSELNVSWAGANDIGNNKWLVAVNAEDHAAIVAHIGVDALPVFPLDGKMNAMNTNAKNALTEVLTRRGFTSTANGADGYRELLNSAGRELRPNFDIDKINAG